MLDSRLVLGCDDPLPHIPRRVLLAGVTGVGKSTLGRRLGKLWGLPYTEMDALHWGPDWSTRETFLQDAREVADQDAWITEWQYWSRGFKHGLGDRADTLIWLNFPRPVALLRLLRRTVRRSLTREQLWAGNAEPPLWAYFTAPETHILRWEHRTHDTWRRRMPDVREEFPQLTIVELRSPREVARWLSGPAARRA